MLKQRFFLTASPSRSDDWCTHARAWNAHNVVVSLWAFWVLSRFIFGRFKHAQARSSSTLLTTAAGAPWSFVGITTPTLAFWVKNKLIHAIRKGTCNELIRCCRCVVIACNHSSRFSVMRMGAAVSKAAFPILECFTHFASLSLPEF